MTTDPPEGKLTVLPAMKGVVVERDELERNVALSRLKHRLFDHNVAVKIGRYHLLEIVGQGGMGVVWGAWDPELDRRVAIKLVKPSLAAARDRILREGQALAKLSHPNVVPIYDVGLVDEQVYLVMEWVRGESLRTYAATPRSASAMVEVYRQAGEGLAAVHAAGLVHRDFKPDNAMRGSDGRVRVLDFGLAQTEDADRGAGTPRYMAPEQRAGEAVSAASDQYAFCVSLRESLGTVPAWIEVIVARGTQTDPAARFPSLPELLRALDRDPAKIRRRRVIAVLGVAALGGAFVIGRSATTAPDTCAGAEREIATAWSETARAKVTSHLRGDEQATRVVHDLDSYAATWGGTHRAACEAHHGGELTTTLYERRLSCLARSKAALGAVAELLSTVADENVSNALIAAHSLPDVRRCADGDAALIAPPPAAAAIGVDLASAAVERARVLAIAVDASAETAAGAAVRSAEATHYAPVIARALLVQGRATIALEHDGADRPLARSVQLAIESGDDATAIEAFARLIFVAKEDKPVDGLSLIEPMATRSGALGVFGRALLYNNLATTRLSHGDRDGARELLVKARSELPDDPTKIDIELVCVSQNLALVAATGQERERAFGAAADTLERVLGPTHASTLDARVIHGFATDNGVLARSRLGAACADYRRAQPHLGAPIAGCEFELAWLLDEVDDDAGAAAAMKIVTTDPQRADRKLAAIATAYLAARSGPADSARRAVAELRETGDALASAPELPERITAADAYIAAARGAEHLGDPASASAAWASALATLERDQHPMFLRRLARARAAVARTLVASRPSEASRLAKLARDWYTAAGGYDAIVRTLPP